MKILNIRSMKYLVSTFCIIVSLFAIQACSQNNGPLAIVKYGPHTIKANQPFNVQKNGQSALWFKMNHDMLGKAFVVVNGTQLSAHVHANLVTVEVPANTFNKAGNYTIYIEVNTGVKTIKSNQLTITAS